MGTIEEKALNQILIDVVLSSDYDKAKKILKIKVPEWVELTNNFNDSPFGMAIKNKDTKMVQMFIDNEIKLPDNIDKFLDDAVPEIRNRIRKYKNKKIGKYADLLGDD